VSAALAAGVLIIAVSAQAPQPPTTNPNTPARAAAPGTQTPPPDVNAPGRQTAGRAGAGAGPARGATGAPTFGTDANAELIFEEHWTNAPLTQPMTQASLGHQNLRLHLYGDLAGIRKTQHPTEDYIYTGETRNNWMITVSDPNNYWDLRLPGKVMLRTRNTGFRVTHIVIRTADGKYFVSEEGSGESAAWMNRDYIMSDLHWRTLTMQDAPSSAGPRKPEPDRAVIVAAGIGAPDLSKIDEIGFTDLMPGGFIPSTTRVNSWAVYGKSVPR
jgi:hypothetical protein